jgi:hypothetical protein
MPPQGVRKSSLLVTIKHQKASVIQFWRGVLCAWVSAQPSAVNRVIKGEYRKAYFITRDFAKEQCVDQSPYELK